MTQCKMLQIFYTFTIYEANYPCQRINILNDSFAINNFMLKIDKKKTMALYVHKMLKHSKY